MEKTSKKEAVFLKILKFLSVFICVGGFLYQASQFLFLYWTYPTVVDIQQIEPSYLQMPSFSICNPLGYNGAGFYPIFLIGAFLDNKNGCVITPSFPPEFHTYDGLPLTYRYLRDLRLYDFEHLCSGFNVTPCLPSAITSSVGRNFCRRFPEACVNNQLPADFQIMLYKKFMKEIMLKMSDHDKLRIPLEKYMNCTIEFAGKSKKCNLESVLGSFYSKEDLPQYCYAIYSKWGNPDKKIDTIPKGAVMRLHFELNSTLRQPEDPEKFKTPRHNTPGRPAVQIAVHSPYFLPSPFLDGMSYIGGRAYELRLKMSERHLLPPPYETNCTDYMLSWRQRGGKGPVNQMSAIQECRVNKTYASEGCIPVTVDYPHTYPICKTCYPDPCNISTFAEECVKLADNFTQPCSAITYEVGREDKVITTFVTFDSAVWGFSEAVRKKILAHDCEGNRIYRKECSTIDVDILFDRFEITNLTYNAKFESLELFSVIGGYMGMWLGVSLLTVYDFIGTLINSIKAYRKQKREKTKRLKVKKERFLPDYLNRTKKYPMDNEFKRRRGYDVW